jgi:hypothetical protein
MNIGDALSTADVLAAFSEEIALQGGDVKDVFDDGRRLMARSVLPRGEDVAPGDRLQGGVALKAWAEEVAIHPYVFRLVCSNGAIMAQTVASRQISILLQQPRENLIVDLREAVRACCMPEVFVISVDELRAARITNADRALTLLPILSRLQGIAPAKAVQEIVRRFFEDGDKTRFGLMNAVTSVGRDTPDPETRWNLQLLGGEIGAGKIQPTRQMQRRSQSRRRGESRREAELVS